MKYPYPRPLAAFLLLWLLTAPPAWAGGRPRLLAPLVNRTLSGTVFEDRNYPGGAGRPLSGTAGAAGVNGARVEIFNAAGVFIATTTTAAGGTWSVSVPENATYTVRVASTTVPSGRGFAVGSAVTVPQAVTTFVNGDVNRVGGENPARTDGINAATLNVTTLASLTTATTTAQVISSVPVAMADVSGVDFGFSFNVITTTNDTGIGSLRQFIANANRLSNTGLTIGATSTQDVSVFMIPDGNAHPGLRSSAQGLASQLTGGRAVLTVGATALPTLTDAATVIDGTTQTANVGDTNAGDANGNVIGSNGNTTVGIGPDGVASTGDEYTLPGTRAPEVELVGPGGADLTGTNQVAITINGADVRIAGLAIRGFSGRDIFVAPATGRTANNLIVESCLFGSAATGLADPTGTNRSRRGIELIGTGTGSGSNIIIRNNVFAYSRMGAILLDGIATGAFNTLTIEGNDISNVGLSATTDGQGILLRGPYASAVVRRNRITLPATANDQGLEVRLSGNSSATGAPGVLVTENTVSSAAATGIYFDEQTAGAGGANPRTATVTYNLISTNRNQGLLLLAPQAQWLISQNSIFNNGTGAGGLGLDLGPVQSVTVNDNNDSDTGPNGLLNQPVFTTAIRRGANVILSGYARPGTAIELFVANPDGTGFGEGQTYLLTLTEGSAADADGGTGAYSGTINGLNQGADNTNRFEFTIPLPVGTTTGTVLTATGTLGGMTSEFAGNVVINVEPDAVDDFGFTPAGVAVGINVTANDTDSDGTIAAGTVDLDTLTAGRQSNITTAAGTYIANASGVVTFTPAGGFTGTAVLGYTVNDNLNASSDKALLTIYVGPQVGNDLATTTSDQAVTVVIFTNDTDVNGLDAATVDLDPATAGQQTTLVISGQGTAVVDASGSVLFTPLVNYAGPVSFSYTVQDLTGSVSVSATVNITVTSAPPVAQADVARTPANTVVTFSLTDNDYDLDGTVNLATVDLDPGTGGQQTTLTVVGQGAFAADNAGNVTFTPVNGFTGTTTASYLIRDNNGVLALTPGNITVFVGPIANADAATTGASIAVSIPVSGNDVDVNGLDLASIDFDFVTAGIQGTLTVVGQGTFATDNAGNVVFTPTGTFTGSTVVQYVISDINGATSLPASLTVTSTNLAPTAVNDVLLTPANVTGSVNATANDSDPDGGLDVTTVDLDPGTVGTQTSRAVTGGTFSVNSSGVVSLVPTSNFTGIATVTYTVRDLTTATSNVATITAYVGPRAIADAATTNYAVPVSVNVATNDIDADGLNFASVDLDPATAGRQTSFFVANRGTFTVDNAGLVTFTPAVGVTGIGSAVVNYTIEDVNGSVSLPVALTITTTTTAPTVTADVLLLPPNVVSTIDLVTNDSDLDGTLNAATIDLNTGSSGQQTTRSVTGGVFNVDGAGVVTVTPTASFTGVTTAFTYNVRDNTGVLSSNTANITVYYGPITGNDFASVAANTAAVFTGATAITVNDTDVDGFNLTTIDLDLATPGVQQTVTQAGTGTWTYNSGTNTLTFTPVVTFRGLATIQYRLNDNRGGGLAAPSTIATVSVLVDAVQPLARPDSVTVSPNITVATSATITLLANDVAVAPATLRFQTLDFNQVTAGFQVGTIGGGFGTTTIPGEGVWTIPVNGSGVPTGSTVTFQPVTGFTGTSILRYTVNDNAAPTAGTSNVATFRAFVGPIPTNDFATTAYTAPVSFNIVSNDTDVNGVNPATVDLDPGIAGVQTSRTVAGGTFNVDAAGVVTFTPTGTFVGSATTTYQVRDINGAISNAANLATNGTITVTVTTVAPVAVADLYETPPNATGLPTVPPSVLTPLTNDNDPDGTLNVATIDLNPGNGTGLDQNVTDGNGNGITANASGQVTFTPALNTTANVNIPYTVRDNTGTTSNTVNIRMLIGPNAQNDVGATNLINPVTVIVLANDVDANGININTVDLDPTTPGFQTTRVTAAGTFVVLSGAGLTGRIRFTPSAGFSGTASVPYTVDDNEGGTSNVATLFITVATNPVAQNDNVATPPNTAITFNPLTNDNSIDGSGLNVNSIDLDPSSPGTQETTFTVAGQGTFVLGPVAGQITFTPALNFTGTCTGATYTVRNNNALVSNAATLTVRVGPLTNPDEALSLANIVNTNNSALFNVVNNDVDADGVALNRTDLDPVAAGRQTDITNAQGRWRADNVGRVRFNPALGFTGTATFQYVTQDLTNAPSNVGGLTVHVGPITATDNVTTGYATPINITVLTNDLDADGFDSTSVDLDVNVPGQQTTRTVAGRGIFTVATTGANKGRVTYTPTASFIGVTTISYVVRDVFGALSNQSNIVVTTTTTAPVAVNDVANTPAGVAVLVPILANDSDADGTLNGNSVDLDQVTAGRQNLFVVSGQGTFTVNGAGNLTFTPLAGFTNTSQVTYTVRDNTGTNSNVATVTVNVGPLTTNETGSTASNTSVSANVLTNDVDANGIDPTTVDLDLVTAGIQNTFTAVGQGTYSVDAAGLVTFVPALNYTGTSFVQYTVRDLTGATSTTGRWTLGIGPVAVNNAVSIAYNAASVAVNVTTNDVDATGINRASVDLDPATAGFQTSFAVAGQGTFTVTGVAGVVTFAPSGTFAGLTSVAYTVNDNQGNRSNAATFTVTTTTVAPVANPNSTVTAPVTPVTLDVTSNDTDADGTIATTTVDLDPATAGQQTSLTVAGEGAYAVSGGVVTFTPQAGYTGTSVIQYTVRDNAGAVSNAANITMRVGPLTADDAVTISSNATTLISILANDVDANGLAANTVDLDPATALRQTTLVVLGGTFTVDAAGVVTFVPTTNFVGTAIATYVLNDATGAPSRLATLTITMNTQPPVAVNDTRTTPSNTTLTFVATANDTDADGTVNPATVDFNPGLAGQQTSATLPGQGQFSVDNTGTVTFVPALDYTGVATLTYTVQDNTGATSNVGTITVDVGPLAGNDAATVLYNTTVVFNVLANDTDASGLQTGSVDLDPSTPLVQDVTRLVTGQGTFTVSTTGLTAGEVTFVPVFNFTGVSSISYTVKDAGGSTSNVATITVTVTNAAPTAVADDAQTPANVPVTFDVIGNDSDGDGTIDGATVDLQPGVAGLQNSVTVSGQGVYTADGFGNVTFTPTASYTGTSLVQYTVRDNVGATSNVAQITVRVGPLAGNDEDSTPSNTILSFSLIGNDTDVNGLAAATIDLDPSTPLTRQTSRTVPGQGVFTVSASGIIIFTPALDFTGTSVISYTIDDATGARSSAALITVHVGPVARDDAASTPYTAATSFFPLANDEDVDGIDPNTLDLNPGVAGIQTTRTVVGQGTFVYTPLTGEVVFTPTGSFAGVTTITYTVNDNLGVQSNVGVISINVTTSAPIALDNSALTAPATAVSFVVIDNDSDPDGTVNQASVDLNPAQGGRQIVRTVVGQGTFSVDNTGQVTFTPVTGFTGTSQIQYLVRDNTGTASNNATITVTVGPLTQNDEALTPPATAVTFDALANDVDADFGGIDPATLDLDPSTPLVRDITRTVAGQGTFTVDNLGNVTFTPQAGFTGTSTITYMVRDQAGAPSSISNLTVHVGPLTADDSGQSINNQPVTLIVFANDVDVDGIDPATLDLDPSTPAVDPSVTVAGQGTFQANPDGSVTFTPVLGFIGGPVTTPYIVRDIFGAPSNQSVISIIVAPFADVVTIISGTRTAGIGAPVTYTVTTFNRGPSDAANVVVLVQLPTNLRRMNGTLFGVTGAVYDADFGTLTYAPITLLAAGDTVRNTFTFRMPTSGFASGVVSATTQTAGPAGTSDPVIANNNGSQSASQINTTGTLPVELTRFTAKGRGVDAQLTWATASERNAAYFAVERSTNGGATYQEVGRRTAAGTTSAPREYALTDTGIGRTARTVYYRLRQVDVDGTTEYSEVQAVTFTGRTLTHAVAVFPNPVSAATTTTPTVDLTELEAGTYAVTLFDATGRRVLTATQAGGTTQPLNVEALPVGTYLLRVTGPTGFAATTRLLKQ